MAGVALGDIILCFAWQACYFATLTLVLRGNRGAYDGAGLDLEAHFVAASRPGPRGTLRASQVWRLWRWAASGGALGACWSPGRCGTLRGRRGTWRHPPALCVAGVTLMVIKAG